MIEKPLLERIKQSASKGPWRPIRRLIKEFLNEYGGSDKHRVARIFEIDHQTARGYLQELHKKNVLYISGWTRNHANSKFHPIYSIRRIQDTDEEKPHPITQSLSMKRYRQMLKTKGIHNGITAISRSQESSGDLP